MTKEQEALITKLSKQSKIDFLVWEVNEEYYNFKIYFGKYNIQIEKLNCNSQVPISRTGLDFFKIQIGNYGVKRDKDILGSFYINSNKKIYSKISRIYNYMLSLYLININNFKLGNSKQKYF